MAKNTNTIAKCLAMLAGTYRVELDDFATEAYRIALEDLPNERISAATKAILRSPSYEFMPTPGKIRELAITNGRGTEQACDAAWMVLCEAVRRFGSDQSVNFRDALINATVRIRGGWQRCCSLEAEEFEKWYRKEFSSTYSLLISGGNYVGEELVKYLPGNMERENAQWVGRTDWGKGDKVYELPPPVEVGCDYEPALLSAPGQTPALNHRPADIPRIELKKVSP